MSSGGLSTARLARLHEVLSGYVERAELPGVVALVARGKDLDVTVVGSQDLATQTPIRRDTLFRIASMTKPITAVATLMLVEEARVRLNDPVEHWLPELAGRKVLRTPGSTPDDVVPANRPITLRDLLTLRFGLGLIMAPPGTYPIQQAIADAGLGMGSLAGTFTPDEYMRRLGTLPLVHQPGERWMYHTGSDVLGVLVARCSGMRFGDFLQERIFAPLGMKDTGFHVPQDRLDRFATAYRTDPQSRRLVVHDEARGGAWSRPAVFQAGGGGLVCTLDDYLAFGRMMLNMGRHGSRQILSRPAVELMTTDQLTEQQKSISEFFPGFWDSNGWGFGVGVTTRRRSLACSPGDFGWDGAFSTSWRSDPREDMVMILMTQRLLNGPESFDINIDFPTLARQAIED